MQAGQVTVCGDLGKMAELLSLLDEPRRMFEIVEPRKIGNQRVGS
jgi:hypothetical protein